MPYVGTITIRYVTSKPLSMETVDIIVDELGNSGGHFEGTYIEKEISQAEVDAMILLEDPKNNA